MSFLLPGCCCLHYAAYSRSLWPGISILSFVIQVLIIVHQGVPLVFFICSSNAPGSVAKGI